MTITYFILIATYVAACFKNKVFLYTIQKHFPFFNYWKQRGESLSLLVRFVFLTVFFNTFFDDKGSASNTENH